ncbi:MAG TPA: TlpA disulfide reductase family protein [Acidimicrobiia bacterium]|nr:TlpA disulfide reductase family protein [Acidimicrobiia bacterium]
MRVRARFIAIAFGLVLVAFGVVLAVQHRTEPSVPRLVQQHDPAPSFKVKTLDGKVIDSASLRGKTYVVNFFNSWCIPCRQEAPALAAFYNAHKGEHDFAMIGIVHDDDPSAARAYAAQEKIAWPVGLDPNGAAALGFGTTGQPETYVIAPDGVAVCGTLGPSTQTELDTWLQAARNGQACV